LINERFDAASKALQTAGLVDRTWVQKTILRLNDEELKIIKKGLKKDKINDLEVESTQITPLEGPENGGNPTFGDNINMQMPSGADQAGPAIDLGGIPGLSEDNDVSLTGSIEDDDYPIKVQKMLERNFNDLDENSLSTGINADIKPRRKRDDPGKIENTMDEDEWERKSSIKIKKSDVPSAKDITLEEDFDINEYLDTQISFNASINNRMKSTLNRFTDKHGTQPRNSNKSIIISENNSSGEEKDD